MAAIPSQGAVPKMPAAGAGDGYVGADLNEL